MIIPYRSGRPSWGALHTPAAAASCDADPPRMATHTVAATTARPIAGGRLAVAPAERIRDAPELCEWAAARTCGCCTLGTTSGGGRQKRRRARLKALPRAPVQHFFPAGAETLPGCGHAGPDGAAARAPTLLARSALRRKGEDHHQQRRYQRGRRSHPKTPRPASPSRHCHDHEDQPTASIVPSPPRRLDRWHTRTTAERPIAN